MKNKDSAFTRRCFLRSGLEVTAAFSLQHAARSLAIDTPVCRLSAQQEVGPYFIPDELFRPDITEGKAGVPLTLRIALLDARNCKPLPDAAVDVWHCDAVGLYSGFTQQRFPGPPPGEEGGPPPPPPGEAGFDPGFFPDGPGGPPPNHAPSDKLTFLRGIQRTGPDGAVSFRTVFPGFYMGRTNHIHYKVRVGGRGSGLSYAGGHTSYIGQVFFPEEITAGLMEDDPYRRHKIHRTTQAEDRVFAEQQGELAIAHLRPVKPGQISAGLAAELTAAVDPASGD